MESLRWREGILEILDQTRLPLTIEYVQSSDYLAVANAIKSMQVRGAPAIGSAAAFGYAMGAREHQNLPREQFLAEMQEVKQVLASTRPTAVNLFWALDRMEKKLLEVSHLQPAEIADILLEEAKAIHQEDLELNRRMGEYGQQLIPSGARILTHCNAGALATAGFGTALGVIRAAHAAGKQVQVYADETRPLLQGARLTAFELMQDGIPVTLITDNMAGYLMRRGMVDLVIVGADRITANGDVANKIGTYGLAVLAKENKIPFYVAAPYSTVDLTLASGDDIPIEERDPREITHICGQRIAPEGVKVFNPAFDITPNYLIDAIITEKGIIRKPYKVNLQKTYGEGAK
ncbi:methylthioribose-1-phosphate isomerase [Carboxydocella sporoproducens DSM 16521]|uniref:Methylthioribose-1-phosphate isomerase n=2 Tax=Carboxydocella TaxID=178898 RepID=A0A1T4PXG8_9FIRM|nr:MULTISPECIES: S-methyl-5-thioribose-1-phosphate isomerase [Carboxydocella]AVX20471.1 methylthioribose-1-phosphate isomerase [Carboxydocella thermautotrophica]SJZ95931.1 methylthioribose-1-phosphate isomerase [Carboxydocella sporoproducens DSM 16521]